MMNLQEKAVTNKCLGLLVYLPSVTGLHGLGIASALGTVVVLGNLVLFYFRTGHVDPHTAQIALNHRTTVKGLAAETGDRVPRCVI